ncbi:MAG: hypothetical protein ACYTGG_10560 [Planctomycetota bacterium]|jgi:hypothetical protein
MERYTTLAAIALAAAFALGSTPAAAQTFGLDDNPSMPLGWGTPGGPIPGYGAENPFGIPGTNYPTGWAPSPSLAAVPSCMDATLLAPGMLMQLQTPLGHYDDSYSSSTVMANTIQSIKLRFSVDRVSSGVAGSAVAIEAAAFQHPGDIFSTTDRFANPDTYKGQVGPPGYGGVLPAPSTFPGPRNNLVIDDTTLGLLCGGVPCPPSPQPAPHILPGGTHDNLDQFDQQPILPGGIGPTLGWQYFTFYPDEALLGVPQPVAPADIYDVATGWSQTMFGFPFATAPMLGLDQFDDATDSIDALIMFDNHFIGGPGWNGVGAEPNIDYALFSLAPGSASLIHHGLNASDVFYTNFSGTFWLYAPSANLGLRDAPGGLPSSGPDNVDALEILYHCQQDLNGDSVVDIQDLLMLLGAWGPCHGCQHDLSDDGSVTIVDILALIGAWGACPP